MALNESDIAHLIRRTEVISNEAKVNELINSASREAAVDIILERNFSGPGKAAGGVNLNFSYDDASQPWAYVQEMRRWWIDEFAFGAQPLREKMTLFWHNHFVSSDNSSNFYTDVISQNQLYRDMAVGNFRDLAKKMSVEPLMLSYLNNGENTKNNRNENFARELLELFILGLNNYGLIPGQAWPYTQEDVVAASKAWTGHNLPWVQNAKPVYVFRADKHDDSSITFLGKTGKFDGFAIIDHVLGTDPYKTIAARFIATKLWSFFAYPNPDANLIAGIVSSTNFHNTWNIRDLLREILVHDEFYSTKSKTGVISTPVEFVARLFNLVGVRKNDDHNAWAAWNMRDMAMDLFNPPNVAGWKQNSYWLSTSALGARGKTLSIEYYSSTSTSKFVDLESASVDNAVTIAARRVGLMSLSTETRSNLTSWLTSKRVSGVSAQHRSAGLFHLLLMSPDFQIA